MKRSRGYKCNLSCPCKAAASVRQRIHEVTGIEVEEHSIGINPKHHKSLSRDALALEFIARRRQPQQETADAAR